MRHAPPLRHRMEIALAHTGRITRECSHDGFDPLAPANGHRPLTLMRPSATYSFLRSPAARIPAWLHRCRLHAGTRCWSQSANVGHGGAAVRSECPLSGKQPTGKFDPVADNLDERTMCSFAQRRPLIRGRKDYEGRKAAFGAQACEEDVRIAAIADVHGNLLALEATLAHMRRFSPDVVVNLGDLVSGPFDPAGSADAQMHLDCLTLAGNHERQLLEGGNGFSDAFARPLLSAAHLDWIAGLPKTITLADGDMFACHGSPAGGDLEYLLEDVSSGKPTVDSADAILGRLAGIGDASVRPLRPYSHSPRRLGRERVDCEPG